MSQEKTKNIRLSLTFSEDFEFAPHVAEQFFVRAMNRGKPIFLTKEFLEQVGRISPDELVERMIEDLRGEPRELNDPALTWYYLFMDFKEDFPRLLQLLADKEAEKS